MYIQLSNIGFRCCLKQIIFKQKMKHRKPKRLFTTSWMRNDTLYKINENLISIEISI